MVSLAILSRKFEDLRDSFSRIANMTLHQQQQRQKVRRAFTLMEMLIVVAIIVALAGIATVYIIPQFSKSKEQIAKAGAYTVEKALIMYWKDNDQNYPPTLEALTVRDDHGAPYLKAEDLLDRWR